MNLQKYNDKALMQGLRDALSRQEAIEVEFKRRHTEHRENLEEKFPGIGAIVEEGVALLLKDRPSVFIVERLCPHCGEAVERVR